MSAFEGIPLSPPVLQSSVHIQSTIIPQKYSTSFIFHLLKGFHGRSILAKDKGYKTKHTNKDSPCTLKLRGFYEINICLINRSFRHFSCCGSVTRSTSYGCAFPSSRPWPDRQRSWLQTRSLYWSQVKLFGIRWYTEFPIQSFIEVFLQGFQEFPRLVVWAATAASYCPRRAGDLPKQNMMKSH